MWPTLTLTWLLTPAEESFTTLMWLQLSTHCRHLTHCWKWQISSFYPAPTIIAPNGANERRARECVSDCVRLCQPIRVKLRLSQPMTIKRMKITSYLSIRTRRESNQQNCDELSLTPLVMTWRQETNSTRSWATNNPAAGWGLASWVRGPAVIRDNLHGHTLAHFLQPSAGPCAVCIVQCDQDYLHVIPRI